MNSSFVKTPSEFFSRKKRLAFFVLFGSSVLLASMLQGCSDYGFHLRNNVELPPQYHSVSLENLPADNDFREAFEEALENAGGSLIAEGEDSSAAKSIIRFKDFKQDKRVIAYTSERKAREYLLYLKFNYEVSIIDRSAVNAKKKKEKKLPVRRINIDKSYLYDPDFALGKAEEEKLVKKKLYQEASRLILLRLQYSK